MNRVSFSLVLSLLFLSSSPAFSQRVIDLDQVWGDVRIMGAEWRDNAGASLASADVNNDGLQDLIIGAAGHTMYYPGKVFVLFGREDLPSTIDFAVTPADLTVKGWHDEGYPGMGRTVAGGDVNADGIADIIIGAVHEAYIIFGSEQLPSLIDLKYTAADLTIYGADTVGSGSMRVSCGDINDDGIRDLLIGEPGAWGPGRWRAGKVYAIYGRENLPREIDLKTEAADFTLIGDKRSRLLGGRITSGDVNGDGVSDVIAYGSKMVFVVYGRTDLPEVIDLEITPADVAIRLGSGVRCITTGDVNGDGWKDLLMGTTQSSSDTVLVIYGSDNLSSFIDLTVDPADVTIIGKEEDDYFARGLATGDYSGDSIVDIFVGAPGAEVPGGSNAGKAYVLNGSSSLPAVIDLAEIQADITILGDDKSDYMGRSVLISDLNGDWLNELIVGAPQGFVFAGAPLAPDYLKGEVYLIYGENPFGDSPSGRKEYVLKMLTEVETKDKHTKKRIKHIIEHIKKSLNRHPKKEGKPWKKYELWIDDSHLDEKHGHKVFYEEKKAAKDLEKLCKGLKCKGVISMMLAFNGADAAVIEIMSKGTTYFGPEEVQPGDSIYVDASPDKFGANTEVYLDAVLDQKIHTSCSKPIEEGMVFGDFEIVDLEKLYGGSGSKLPPGFCAKVLNLLIEADSTLARIAIEEAKDAGGKEKEIEKAEKEMAKALRELSKGKYHKAIDHYKHAWKHAMKAVKKHKQKKMEEGTQLSRTMPDDVSRTFFSLTPNPFRQNLVVAFSLSEPGPVSLRIYDITGSLIRTLVDDSHPAGVSRVAWDGTDESSKPLSSGTYFTKMMNGDYARTEKVVLIR